MEKVKDCHKVQPSRARNKHEDENINSKDDKKANNTTTTIRLKYSGSDEEVIETNSEDDISSKSNPNESENLQYR